MKILVAVEDETFGEYIAQFLAAHEWPEGSEFRLFHVLEPIMVPPLSGYPSELVHSVNEERRRAAKSLLLTLGTQLTTRFPHMSVKEELIDGYPKEVILKLAEQWPADMIVMGSHGRHGIGKFLLGSVSMSVLSAAPCSLMVVKRPQEAQPDSKAESKVEAAVH